MIKVNVNLLVILQRHGCKMELSLVLLCYTAEKKRTISYFVIVLYVLELQQNSHYT